MYLKALATPSRIPDNLHEALRQIRAQLELEHGIAAPSVQDMITVALRRLLSEWEDPVQQQLILLELLSCRREARGRMGKLGRVTQGRN